MNSSSSPLKQVNTGQVTHTPKSAALYKQLFDTQEHPPGFWVEFFILPLSKPHLQQALAKMPRESVILDPIVLRTLFSAGASNVQNNDEFIATNSLCILTVVLEWLLNQNFSSRDVLAAIAGLDTIDKVFDDLGRGLARRLESSPEVALTFFLTVLPAANGTSVSTYLSSRNFFRPIISLIDTEHAPKALTLLGLFSLLNKREDHADPYRIRLADFIDEDAIQRALSVIGKQLDLASPEDESTWLGWFQKKAPRAINSRPLAILHSVYEFCLYNELFDLQFIRSNTFTSFFRVAQLVVQNQHTAAKLRDYSILILFILRVLVERKVSFNELCDPANQRPLAILQERTPYLAQDTNPRTPLAALLDILQCCLRFNVRKNMDLGMYNEALTVIYQIVHSLRDGSKQVYYDWPQLVRTIFSVIKHLSKEDATGGEYATAELFILIIATLSSSPNMFGPEYLGLLEKAMTSNELLKTFSLKFGLNKSGSMAVMHAMIGQYELLKGQSPTFELTPEVASQIVKQGQHVHNMHEGDKFMGSALPKFTELSHGPFFAHEARTLLADARAE